MGCHPNVSHLQGNPGSPTPALSAPSDLSSPVGKFFPGRCRFSSTKWTLPTTRLSGVCWHPNPKKPPGQKWCESVLPLVFGRAQNFGPFLLQLTMTPALLQQGRENRDTYHCTFSQGHLPDASCRAWEGSVFVGLQLQLCQKRDGGKQAPFHTVSCYSDRANFTVGSSSDPMVTGQDARGC